MSEKSTILSFRVSPELKRKLEIRAEIERKSLTELVRDTLSHSQGEEVLTSARKEFTELESDANALDRKINDFTNQYKGMLEMLTREQKELIGELTLRKRRLKRDRLLDSLQMSLFCIIGALLGGLGVQIMNFFLHNN